MSEPLAVITGTGRSGTGYTAQVLRAARVVCGHEDWWNPWGSQVDGLDIDSSWCALAVGLDGYSGHVWHQVRHPLDVVSSFVKQPPHDPYRALKNRLLDVVPDSPVEYGMAACGAYLTATEKVAERTWRLDDIDAELIVDLAAAVGITVTPATADTALAIVPRTYNLHGSGERLGWDDLPAGSLRDELADWARRWGWE